MRKGRWPADPGLQAREGGRSVREGLAASGLGDAWVRVRAGEAPGAGDSCQLTALRLQIQESSGRPRALRFPRKPGYAVSGSVRGPGWLRGGGRGGGGRGGGGGGAGGGGGGGGPPPPGGGGAPRGGGAARCGSAGPARRPAGRAAAGGRSSAPPPGRSSGRSRSGAPQAGRSRPPEGGGSRTPLPPAYLPGAPAGRADGVRVQCAW
jgi:hypothetical protein